MKISFQPYASVKTKPSPWLTGLMAVCVLCLAPSPATADGNAHAHVTPPRIDTVSGGQPLALVTQGRPNVEIVIGPKPAPMVRFAAEELARRIGQATGAAIPLVESPGKDHRIPFYLGDQPAVRKIGIHVEKLPRDGFELRVTPQAIYLAGRDDPQLSPQNRGWAVLKEHGTLNAVYGFLERFLGVRYYFPGDIGTVVPHDKNLSISPRHWLDRPDFPRRRTGFMAARTWFPEVDPGMVNLYRFQLREESFYVPCCHGLDRLKYARRLAQSHPDFLAMDEHGRRYLDPASPYFGNICYSHPGMRDMIFQDAKAFLTGQPATARGLDYWDPSSCQPGFFDIMPKDHFMHCMCPRCRDFYATHPNRADLVWDLIRDISGRLKSEGITGYLTMLAYGHYTEVPNLTMPDNLLMQVAVNGPWAETNPRLQRQHDRRILEWKQKTGRKPWLWTYIGKYGALDIDGIPPSTPRAVGNYFRRQAENICGGFLESESDCQFTQYLNLYVFSKVAWDTTTDVDALLAEHHRMMFGPGAIPMGKMLDRLEDLWMHRIAGRIVETPTGPVAIPPNSRELWEDVYSPQQLQQMESWLQQAERKARNHPDALHRITYFRHYLLNPLLRKARDYANQKAVARTLTYRSRTIPHQPQEDDWESTPEQWLVPLGRDETEVQTTFKALCSQDMLHVRIHCQEPHMEAIKADVLRRDADTLWTDSVVELLLNPSGDQKDYLHFIVNAKGVLYDSQNRREGAGGILNPQWDSTVRIRVTPHPEAWDVALDIPLAELDQFNPGRCLLNVARHRALKRIQPKVTLYAASPFVRNFHDVQHFLAADFTGAKTAPLLVSNGTMEAPIKGRSFGKWYTSQQAIDTKAVALDSRTFRSAGQSLRLTAPPDRPCPGATQYLTLKPNATYRLSFMLKTKDVKPDGKGYLGRGGAIVNLAIPSNHWYDPNYYLGTMPWTNQSFVFRTGTLKPKQKFYIRLLLLNATGTAWFDNVYIQELTNH